MASAGGDGRPGGFWEQLVGEDSQPPGRRNRDLFAAAQHTLGAQDCVASERGCYKMQGRVLRVVVGRGEGRGLLDIWGGTWVRFTDFIAKNPSFLATSKN